MCSLSREEADWITHIYSVQKSKFKHSEKKYQVEMSHIQTHIGHCFDSLNNCAFRGPTERDLWPPLACCIQEHITVQLV